MAHGLTIGQAAAFAEATMKTVRWYQRLGLIDERERDNSGYRRYRSTDLLRPVQVRSNPDPGRRACRWPDGWHHQSAGADKCK